MPPDLRLVVVAVAVWGTVLVCLPASPFIGAVIAALAAVSGIVWRRRTALLPALAVSVAIGAFGGAAVTAWRVAVRDADPVHDLAAAHRTVRLTGTVDDDPRVLRDSRDSTTLVAVDVSSLDGDGQRIDLSVRAVLFATGDPARWRELLPGQEFTVRASLSPPDRRTDLTAVVASTRDTPRLRGEPPWWQTIAGSWRDGLRTVSAEVLPSGPAGLLPGLVVGDVSELDGDITEDFRATGLTHLTAVSGANLALVLGVVLLGTRLCRAGPGARVGLGLLAIVGFVILVRPSPSVLRAAVMGGIGLLVVVPRRSGAALPGLAAAVTVLLLWDPALGFDLGFALSVFATAGIVVFAPRWSRFWRARGWPGWLAMGLAVPLSAQLAVTPLLAAVTGSISVVAVPANLLVAAAVPPVTILGLVATGLAGCWPEAAQFAVWLAGWPVRWLIGVARVGADLPAGAVPWPTGWWWGIGLAVLLVTGAVLCRWRTGRRFVVVAGLALCVGVVPARWFAGAWPPPGWLLVACDVGQGDALVLSTGVPHSAVVVDAGPQPGPVDECLRDLEVERVELLVFSHFHADHVGGVAGVFRGRTVSRVLLPVDADPEGGRRRVDAAVAGGRPEIAAPGESWRIGATRIRVLAAGDGFTGTDSDPNNNSLVVRAEIAGVSVLLCGDVEEPAQRALLDSGVNVDVDVLKVPHHGSAAFLPEFYRAASPRVGVVSVGVGNDYGHPSSRSIRQLRGMGAAVLRTDTDGTVAIVSTSEGLAVLPDAT